jgi:hypothetical protein
MDAELDGLLNPASNKALPIPAKTSNVAGLVIASVIGNLANQFSH